MELVVLTTLPHYNLVLEDEDFSRSVGIFWLAVAMCFQLICRAMFGVREVRTFQSSWDFFTGQDIGVLTFFHAVPVFFADIVNERMDFMSAFLFILRLSLVSCFYFYWLGITKRFPLVSPPSLYQSVWERENIRPRAHLWPQLHISMRNRQCRQTKAILVCLPVINNLYSF